jgi:hypothetical protein
MQAALIIMTILGCDDTATQCHFVEMLDERWATVQACDAGSEDKLRGYSNLNYPVVVAVCQTPGDTGLNEIAGEPAEPELTATAQADTSLPAAEGVPVPKADIPPADTTLAAETAAVAEDTPGMTAKVLNLVRNALPEAASLKALVSEPVHVVTDSYSWVAQRFEK